MTILELVTALSILGLVLSGLLAAMSGAQSNLERQISRTDSNDQVRLAVQSLDREIRSGDVLYDPAGESYSPGDVAPGMSIRIYTESNAPTRGGKRCVQWRITSAGELQARNWDPNWQTSPSTLVTKWRIVATNVTNRTDSIAAFSRPTPTTTNLIGIALRTNNSTKKGSTVEEDASVSGRNTIFFSASQVCGPATPDPALSGQGGSKVPPY